METKELEPIVKMECEVLPKETIRTNILREKSLLGASIRSALSTQLGSYMEKQLAQKGVGFSSDGKATFSDAITTVLMRECLNANLKAIKLVAELTDIPYGNRLAPDGLERIHE